MTMLMWLMMLVLPAGIMRSTPPAIEADTLRLKVGSPEVDGRVFPVHRARNRVYLADMARPTTSWTNELVLGDSAGRPVMRWITRGAQANGITWELLQTYDARTLAPLAWARTASNGAEARLRIDGTRVTGMRKGPGTAVPQQVDQTLPRAGFIASASDLIPMAVGLKPGAVMIAPVWGPQMAEPEDRIFSVLGEETVRVEGSDVTAWKVEERVAATDKLTATWYLTEKSPYMVYAEIPLADGGMQRITGVALDHD